MKTNFGSLLLMLIFLAFPLQLFSGNLNNQFKKHFIKSNYNADGPTICYLENNNIVISWADNRNGDFDVFFQIFDQNNNPLSDIQQVNDERTGHNQMYPAISSNENNFVIAWSDRRNGNFNVYLQCFDHNGNKIHSNVKVNDNDGIGIPNYEKPAIVYYDNGFLVAWEDHRDQSRIYRQIFNLNGYKIGTNARISNDFSDAEYRPVAAKGVYGPVVAFHSDLGSGMQVYFALFDQNGQQMGWIKSVNEIERYKEQYFACVCAVEDGILVGWGDYLEGAQNIKVRKLDGKGSLIGSPVLINDNSTSDVANPIVTSLGIYGAAVCWSSTNNSLCDIYFQRVTSSGIKQNSFKKIGQSISWYQNDLISNFSQDEFVVASLDGYEFTNIYFQRFNPYGNPVSEKIYLQAEEQDYINILQPNSSGFREKIGGSLQITWESNFTERVKIELHKESYYYKTISSNTDNDGRFYWTIPVECAESDKYSIKISSTADETIYACSQYFFTLEIPDNILQKIAINEIRYDDAGYDDKEFVEIVCAAGYNLDGFKLVHYNGSYSQDGAVFVHEISNFLVPQDTMTVGTGEYFGFYVLAFSADITYMRSSLVPNYDELHCDQFQNGPDGVALYRAIGNISRDTIIDAVAWGDITSSDLLSDDPGYLQNTGSQTERFFLHDIPESNDSDNSIQRDENTWFISVATPGKPNFLKSTQSTVQFTCNVPNSCQPGQDFWLDIQIDSSASPINDLYGASFVLNYQDTQWLDVVSPQTSNVVVGDIWGSSPVFFSDVDDPAGQVSLGISRKSGGVNGDGDLARIHFKVPENTPEGTTLKFYLSDLNIIDSAGNPISITSDSAVVQVTRSHNPTDKPCLCINGPTECQSGSDFWVDIEFDNTAAAISDFFGASFVVNYQDTQWLDVAQPHSENVLDGGFLGSNPVMFTDVDDNAGQVSFGMSRKSGAGGVNGYGSLARIHFLVQENTPAGTILSFDLADLNLIDSNGNPIELTTKPLAVTVQNTSSTENTLVMNLHKPGQGEIYYDLTVSVQNVIDLFGAAFKVQALNNADYIEMVDVSYNGVLSDVLTVDSIEDGGKSASIGMTLRAGQSGFTGSGKLCHIQFKVVDGAPASFESSFEIIEAQGNHSDGTAIHFQTQNSSFRVAVEERHSIPNKVALYSNYPNPFNPSTMIQFELPQSALTRLDIVNINGKIVKTLVNEYKNTGSYSVQWDATDDAGQAVATGVYLYRLQFKDQVITKKLLFTK